MYSPRHFLCVLFLRMVCTGDGLLYPISLAAAVTDGYSKPMVNCWILIFIHVIGYKFATKFNQHANYTLFAILFLNAVFNSTMSKLQFLSCQTPEILQRSGDISAI
jgi:hypothetical protein